MHMDRKRHLNRWRQGLFRHRHIADHMGDNDRDPRGPRKCDDGWDSGSVKSLPDSLGNSTDVHLTSAGLAFTSYDDPTFRIQPPGVFEVGKSQASCFYI